MKNESIKSTQIIAVFLAEVVCDFFFDPFRVESSGGPLLGRYNRGFAEYLHILAGRTGIVIR